jgi:methionyl-tRNA formyltransferase
MKIAIIGRTEILYKTVEVLLDNGYEIPLIVTSEETPEYKKSAEDFEKLARRIDAKYLYTSKLSSIECINFIKNCDRLDIAVSINYASIISQEVIDLFPCGILNAHGGNLPKYRGNACSAWAILNGEENIGLCIHKMVGSEVDSGDIIEREYLDININTKIGVVWEWMARRIPQLFLSALIKLQKNKDFILEAQSEDPKDALRCYPRIPEDGRIDWSKSNTEILRLINASSKPYSGAFCFYEGKKIIILDAVLHEDQEVYLAVPGQIAKIDPNGENVIVITGKGKLGIKEIEYQGDSTKPSRHIKSVRKRLH